MNEGSEAVQTTEEAEKTATASGPETLLAANDVETSDDMRTDSAPQAIPTPVLADTSSSQITSDPNKAPDAPAYNSLSHIRNPMTWLTCAQTVTAVASLVLTGYVASAQTRISEEVKQIESEANRHTLEMRDLSMISGVQVSMDEYTVSFKNESTDTILNAGYWALSPADGTMTEFQSRVGPILGCSTLTFHVKDLPGSPASLTSTVFVFRVPSGHWWWLSDTGLLEKSEYKGDSMVDSLIGFRSYSLLGDTLSEGYSKWETRKLESGTAPQPVDGSFVTDSFGGVPATIAKSSCN